MRRGKKKKSFLDFFDERKSIIVVFLLMIIVLIYSLVTEPVPYCKTGNFTAQQEKGFNHVIDVHGNSMTPTIKDGESCLCQTKTSYSVGDIILYYIRDNGTPQGIIHRIVAENELGNIMIKGENNTFSDSVILSPESIVCSVPIVPAYKI